MKFFQEFFIIIFFSVLGEGIRIFAHLPIPGSILGILFFSCWCRFIGIF